MIPDYTEVRIVRIIGNAADKVISHPGTAVQLVITNAKIGNLG